MLHIKAILDVLGPLPKTRKKLRVVLDSCNGAGSLVGPKLIEALGAEVIPINVTPDGSFPRPAEPLPENLGDLCVQSKNIKPTSASRRTWMRIDWRSCPSRAKPIGEDYTLVLATLYVLGREKGPVVANLSTTSAVADVAKKFDCPVFLTKIGEVNVTDGDAAAERCDRRRGKWRRDLSAHQLRARQSRRHGARASPARRIREDGHASCSRHSRDTRIVKEKMACPSDRIPGSAAECCGRSLRSFRWTRATA